MAAKSIFYSGSPYGTGDIKTGSPTLTISSGVATLTVAQTGNIGAGCCIEFDSPTVYVYIAPNRLGFDSGGTTELKVDTKIEGGSSGATGIIRAIEVTSGTWVGGDAAGYIYFSTTSGTWQNNEQINRTKPTTSNNIATVDGTLQGNLGNGNTQFVVKQPTGSDAAAVGSAESVISIHHEYASMAAFEAGFTDANHINDTDLTNADIVAYGCCYYDHDDQTADTTLITVSFGTTGASNYLQFYTPVGSAESVNNQRHPGKLDTNKYFLDNANSNSINIKEDFVRVYGLQLRVTEAGAVARRCISVTNISSPSGVYITKNIIIAAYSGLSTGGQGIFMSDNQLTGYIWDNIIYDYIFGEVGTCTGIWIDAVTAVYVYNNTIHNCYEGFDSDDTTIAKNNIVNDCSSAGFDGTFDATSTHNVTNVSVTEGAFGVTHATGTTTDTTANKLRDSGGGLSAAQVGSIVKNTTDTTYSYVTAVDSDIALTLNDDIFVSGEDYEVYTNIYGSITFVNEGGDDFHLAHNDTVAKNKGTDLSSDANLPIWNDIDGEERG